MTVNNRSYVLLTRFNSTTNLPLMPTDLHNLQGIRIANGAERPGESLLNIANPCTGEKFYNATMIPPEDDAVYKFKRLTLK